MRRMRTALDQGLAFERRQDPVHRLGGGAAGSREIGAHAPGLRASTLSTPYCATVRPWGRRVVLGVAAFAVLALGGNIGGANVFVYGIRVLKAEETPPREALNPFGVTKENAPRAVPKPPDEASTKPNRLA